VTGSDALMLAPWALFAVCVVVIFLMLFRSARRRSASLRPRERRRGRQGGAVEKRPAKDKPTKS
jgi:hypothetical protein